MEHANSETLCTVDEYLTTKTGKTLFPSRFSFNWFLQKHRDQLIRSGSVIVVRKIWHVVPEKFYSAVLDIGAAEAEKKLAA